jgi:hypothetical protein
LALAARGPRLSINSCSRAAKSPQYFAGFIRGMRNNGTWEDAMHGTITHHAHIIRSTNRPVTETLHPYVYAAILALALLLVLSAWGFSRGQGGTGLALTVVSLFVLVAVGLPAILWRIWRNHHARGAAQPARFEDWAEGQFVVWQGHLRGKEAAVLVLLPVAAVACGMTILAVIAHFAAVATS